MAKTKTADSDRDSNEQSVSEAKQLSPHLIYEVVRREGMEELKRPAASLLWSGLAAGILISFSVIGEAIFRVGLPEAHWAHLVESIGYSFGFLLVILGRMQLFTENTVTTVLPIVGKPTRQSLLRLVRLWSVVLTANVVGAFFAAAFIVFTPAFSDEVITAIAELSREATGNGARDTFFMGMPAGILVASIVWMLPMTEQGKFPVVLLFTWLIAAGGFTHVIAGSVEMAFLIVTGELAVLKAIFAFFLPVLAGNIAGGTAVFTMLAWGQVKEEVDDPDHPDGEE